MLQGQVPAEPGLLPLCSLFSWRRLGSDEQATQGTMSEDIIRPRQ